MILPKLLIHFLKHRDDPEFYNIQASDSIRWMRESNLLPRQEGKVLDLGCGHGVFGNELRKLGYQVVFSDDSNFLQPGIKDPTFIKANLDTEGIEKLQSSGPYDLVILSNVLEHLRHPDQFLVNAHRLLNNDGILYLSWTNWLSPWGGHEFSPFHYLGPKLGTAIYDILKPARFHRPGENLFVTYIGKIEKIIQSNNNLSIHKSTARYYTEFSFITKIPIVREFLTWNCVFAIKKVLK